MKFILFKVIHQIYQTISTFLSLYLTHLFHHSPLFLSARIWLSQMSHHQDCHDFIKQLWILNQHPIWRPTDANNSSKGTEICANIRSEQNCFLLKFSIIATGRKHQNPSKSQSRPRKIAAFSRHVQAEKGERLIKKVLICIYTLSMGGGEIPTAPSTLSNRMTCPIIWVRKSFRPFIMIYFYLHNL